VIELLNFCNICHKGAENASNLLENVAVLTKDKRTGCYAPCPFDFCHRIGLRPPFSRSDGSWLHVSQFVIAQLQQPVSVISAA